MPEKIYLCVPYCEKDEVKKNGAKWDGKAKRWFVLDKIPDGLKDYEACEIDIKYEDKEIFKSKLKSLFWDKDLKTWFCSKKDFCSL